MCPQPGNASAAASGGAGAARWFAAAIPRAPHSDPSACSCCLDALVSSPLSDLSYPLLHASVSSRSAQSSYSPEASSVPAWVDYSAGAGPGPGQHPDLSPSASDAEGAASSPAPAPDPVRTPSDPYLIFQRATRLRRLCRSAQSLATGSGSRQQKRHEPLATEENAEEDERDESNPSFSSSSPDPVVQSLRGVGCSLNRTLDFLVVDTAQVTLLKQFGIMPSHLQRAAAKNQTSALIIDFQVSRYLFT